MMFLGARDFASLPTTGTALPAPVRLGNDNDIDAYADDLASLTAALDE